MAADHWLPCVATDKQRYWDARAVTGGVWVVLYGSCQSGVNGLTYTRMMPSIAAQAMGTVAAAV